MAETVVEKWSKDVEEMENEATQRWKDNIDALKDAFKTFGIKFESEVSDLEGDARALKKAFEKFANEFSKDVEAMNKEAQKLFSHIWGTQADKEAWQKRFDR